MSKPSMRIRSANSNDWPAIRKLLIANHLPLEGAEDHLADFVVAESAGVIAGCAGLEIYNDVALLRSCAVDATMQRAGLGHRLVLHAIDCARAKGIRELVLMTTTAETFFPRFGFERISRDEVAESLKASAEFRGVCPVSACVMRLKLIA